VTVYAAVAVAAAYLIGSIPFALLVARRRGVDLRRAGSGNVGSTNVLRTAGVEAAIAALLLDVGKGALAVLVARRMTMDQAVATVAGLAAVTGHMHPVWLRFRGGKGVATGAGAFALLAPISVGIAVAAFVVTVWVSRYASLGSLVGALTLAIVQVAEGPTVVAAGATVGALLVAVAHRGNVARLIAGTERQLGR
jgi:glycerol-3-phosphate acyltransferase PlsY